MGGEGVEGGDVGEAELAKGILQDGDTGLCGSRGVGSGVDGFDDFVDLRGDERV